MGARLPRPPPLPRPGPAADLERPWQPSSWQRGDTPGEGRAPARARPFPEERGPGTEPGPEALGLGLSQWPGWGSCLGQAAPGQGREAVTQDEPTGQVQVLPAIRWSPGPTHSAASGEKGLSGGCPRPPQLSPSPQDPPGWPALPLALPLGCDCRDPHLGLRDCGAAAWRLAGPGSAPCSCSENAPALTRRARKRHAPVLGRGILSSTGGGVQLG